jgi:hypothetical protein
MTTSLAYMPLPPAVQCINTRHIRHNITEQGDIFFDVARVTNKHGSFDLRNAIYIIGMGKVSRGGIASYDGCILGSLMAASGKIRSGNGCRLIIHQFPIESNVCMYELPSKASRSAREDFVLPVPILNVLLTFAPVLPACQQTTISIRCTAKRFVSLGQGIDILTIVS